MRRLCGLALVIAACLALTACNGMFGSSSSDTSQSSYNSQSRDSGALGPGTHDQNRE